MRRFFWKFYDAGAGSGGGSAEVELLKEVNKKVDQIKGDYEKEINTLKQANTEAVTKQAEYDLKVKELNEELAAKGATLGEIQNQVKELQAKGGRMSSHVPDEQMGMKQLILKEWEGAAEKVKAFRADIHKTQAGALEILKTKAVGTMTSAASITGTSISVVPTWSNEFATRGRQVVHARDLMRVVQTQTGLFLFMRQNTPTGEGSVGVTAGPGQTKPQIDYDLTMVTVNARYRAGTVDLAAEMQQDIPGLGQFITEELTEDYLRIETFDFIAALKAAATGSTSVPGGVTVTAEKVPHFVANLEQQNYNPDTIVVRPRLWATLLNTKPSDYSVPGGFVITPSGDVIFAGLRLVKCATNALSDTDIMVGDFRKALIVQVAGEGFRVEMFKQHDRAVYNNVITFRGEARAEIAILRPDAFLVGTA